MQLEEALKGMIFNYGDVINITSNSKGKLFIKNFNNESSYSIGSSLQVKITKNGLETLKNTLKVDPIYFNICNKNIDITGETSSNDLVNVWIDGNKYTVKANNEGKFNLPISLESNPTQNTNVTVFSENTGVYNTTLQLNKERYNLQNQSLILQGSWSGYYNVVNLEFNQFNNTFHVTGKNTIYFSSSSGAKAYTVSLYNSQGELIKTESYNGSNTSNEFISDWNNVPFTYGDYLKIISNNLPMYLDNSLTSSSSKLSSNTALYEITKNGLESFSEPTVTVINNTLNISTYANSTVTLEVNNKSYSYKTNSSGQDLITIPTSITKNTPIKVSVTLNTGVKTCPITLYQAGITTPKTYNFEMHRDGSINPGSPLATKGDYMTLTSYEPTPIEYLSKGEISINITGENITGSARLYVQTTSNKVYLGTIKTNTRTEVDVKTPGTLMLSTGNIDLKNSNEFTQFNFNVSISTLRGSYRMLPVFDNRTYCKLASFATNNSSTFKKEIAEDNNKNYGAIIIGDHIRMYVPSASYLGSDFNASSAVNWYNEAFVSDNELNGLSENAKEPINRFHTNFFFVSTSNKDPWAWGTGDVGTNSFIFILWIN